MAQKAQKTGSFCHHSDHSSGSIRSADSARRGSCIPGATPKSELADTVKSVQPMGNAFEQMTWLVYDAVIMILMKKTGKNRRRNV